MRRLFTDAFDINYKIYYNSNGTSGEVVEWFKALVLKTSEVRASVGSNPTLSAIYLLIKLKSPDTSF